VARNPETDPLHVFRFGVSFDGETPLGFTRIDLCPEQLLTGNGSIIMRSAWTPLIIEFLRQGKRSTLDVSAFRHAQDPKTDPADLTFRLHGVRPFEAKMHPINWDASSNKVLMAQFELCYSKLELIEGEIKLFQSSAISPSSYGVIGRTTPVREQPSVFM